MWVEVTNDEKIVYHLCEGELLEEVTMIDRVVIHAEELAFGDLTGILLTLNSITNKRLRVELETCVPFNKLTPMIKKYIDSYYNTDTNEHKERAISWVDVAKI